MRPNWSYILSVFLLASCNEQRPPMNEWPVVRDTTIPATTSPAPDTLVVSHPGAAQISTAGVKPEQVVAFAKTLNGTPYLYASTDPAAGFDCSGFVYYVFKHFGIEVPRSSVDFTNVGKEIDRHEARPGDLILFTGTDSAEKTVGHMGIIVSSDKDSLHFIHSSSGKANGVTTTPLNSYYQGRFMKIIRVFSQNEGKD